MLDDKTRALLGDREAQMALTERGEVLRCPHGEKAIVFRSEKFWLEICYQFMTKVLCCQQSIFYETEKAALKDWNNRAPILTQKQIEFLGAKKCCRTCELSNGNEYGPDEPVDHLVCRFNDGAELFVQPDDYCSYGYKERLSER